MLSTQQKAVYLKYAKMSLPRHTSYPAVPYWTESYSEIDHRNAIDDLKAKKQDLSLYVHIPYCRQLCYYCGCTKEIYNDRRTQASDPRVAYMDALKKEIDTYQDLFPHTVKQIHLGGGTPTYLKPEQMSELFSYFKDRFVIADDSEIAVEIDPRVTTQEHLEAMKASGVNRLSMGIQDFDFKVQKAINRIQSYEMVKSKINACRDLGFTSINFDLIYGLPFQTIASMEDSIVKSIELGADRIAFYRLAMIPEMFSWQENFKKEDMPTEEENLAMFDSARALFEKHGYEFIGLDHFAKKDELLAQATEDKSLRRNFQGMTTGARLPIIGFGPSAVSQTDRHFWQNTKESRDWIACSDDAKTRVIRGLELNDDDKMRQNLIEELYCYGQIDLKAHAQAWEQDPSYFADDIARLAALEKDGILTRKGFGIEVDNELGRALIRLVAAQFDAYVQRQKSVRFSQLG